MGFHKEVEEVGSFADLPNDVASLVEVADLKQSMSGQEIAECSIYQAFLKMATSSAGPSTRGYTIEI